MPHIIEKEFWFHIFGLAESTLSLIMGDVRPPPKYLNLELTRICTSTIEIPLILGGSGQRFRACRGERHL